MGKIPATLILIALVTSVASVATRPLLGTAHAMIPSLVIHIGTSDVYAADITSAAFVFLRPEQAVSAIVHELQATAEQATEPQNSHQVTPGESVHITHTVENQAVTVTIEVTVNVGDPATVEHTTDVHPPDGPEGRPEIGLPIYLPTS